MVAATPTDTIINPSNPAQRYVLWGNGRVDAYGGALPVTGPDFFHRIDQQVAVAIHITNWTTCAGYILDCAGAFFEFNGAPAITRDPGGDYGFTLGLPYLDVEHRYVDWSWNTSGSTSGYVCDIYGEIFPFGGEAYPPRTGQRFNAPAVVGFEMSWAGGVKKAITADHSGALWLDWSATAPAWPPPYFAGQRPVRDLVVTDWSSTKGYILTGDGALHPFGGSPSVAIAAQLPYRAGQDVAREVQVLSAADPARFWEIHSGGQQYEFVASTPPTVTVTGPATTVTDSTRPDVQWDFGDAQGDSQAAWESYVFTQAFVTGHVMTDPSVWASSALVVQSGVNRSTRGYQMPIDLDNGQFRGYVRAKDTADQWSAWSNRGWTQNVAAPATPTSLTATANQAAFSVALSVTATTSGTADRIRFEYSDDAGTTWAPVRGADAVPIATTTTGTDWDIAFGVTRQYRAVAYNTAPRVKSAASNTVSATITATAYVLTSVADSTLGGEFRVQEPVQWTRPVVAGVFQGLGAEFPTVVSDGRPKARRGTVEILSPDALTWAAIEALAYADAPILYRDPHGEAIYCRLVGDWSQQLMSGAATRHIYTTELPLVEVAPPVTVT